MISPQNKIVNRLLFIKMSNLFDYKCSSSQDFRLAAIKIRGWCNQMHFSMTRKFKKFMFSLMKGISSILEEWKLSRLITMDGFELYASPT